ncbi:MAG: hypothetical protein KBA85_09030 [Chloroflexi bacterium]|nr:hypothetical protein [Chloroflexota bacterium]
MRKTCGFIGQAAWKLSWLLGLVVISVSCGSAAKSNVQSGYEITTGSSTDQVTVTPAAGEVVFDIASETGIGRAEISLPGGQWPDRVELRLHLRGLESLTVTYGEVVVRTAVPSSSFDLIDQTVQVAGQPSPSKAADTLYEMYVDAYSAKGPVSIPLENGYFILRLPEDFLVGDHTSFTVEWIDFYR